MSKAAPQLPRQLPSQGSASPRLAKPQLESEVQPSPRYTVLSWCCLGPWTRVLPWVLLGRCLGAALGAALEAVLACGKSHPLGPEGGSILQAGSVGRRSFFLLFARAASSVFSQKIQKQHEGQERVERLGFPGLSAGSAGVSG